MRLPCLVVLSVVALLAGCSDESPSQAVSDMQRMALEGDWAGYYERLDTRSRQMVDNSIDIAAEHGPPELANSLAGKTGADRFEAFRQQGGEKDKARYAAAWAGKPSSETIQGATATVQWQKPDGQIIPIYLAKENGVWKATWKYDLTDRLREMRSRSARAKGGS
jgi:hypothetical protein